MGGRCGLGNLRSGILTAAHERDHDSEDAWGSIAAPEAGHGAAREQLGLQFGL